MKKMRLLRTSALAFLAITSSFTLLAQQPQPQKLEAEGNLAVVAIASSSARFGAPLTGLNDGLIPTPPPNNRGGGGNRQVQPRTQMWLQYEWTQPISTKEIGIYWWNFNNNPRLPEAYNVQYWDGSAFVPVKNTNGMGMVNNQLNKTVFDEVKTTKIRLQLDSADRGAATVLEWVVYQSPNSAPYPPVVTAGVDRDVMVGGKTFLNGTVKSVTPVSKTTWTKASGPGTVQFNTSNPKEATAVFSAPGTYELQLTATEGKLTSSSTLKVTVHEPPKAKRLDVVYTKRYKIDSKLWNDRAKAMIT
ncbi:MAG TPA: hypothetical protein VM888_09745, partial [Chitinophagaceae bacterium]|nr:hypothetical protein [Chitinophagaceae bacterium]